MANGSDTKEHQVDISKWRRKAEAYDTLRRGVERILESQPQTIALMTLALQALLRDTDG